MLERERGENVILQARDDCNKLSFTWTSTDTRSWNIHVMQVLSCVVWCCPVLFCKVWYSDSGLAWSGAVRSCLAWCSQAWPGVM